jgi:hypothetical protein
MEDKALSYRGRNIAEADILFIKQLITDNPSSSRRDLSKKLCEAWNWRQSNGSLRDMVCRGLMLHLHRAGCIELPPVRWVNPNPLAVCAADRKKPIPALVDTTPLQADLAAIRPLEFHQVRHTWEEPLFNSLLDRYHYLGYAQPVGEHLKFLIYATGRPIACLAWSSVSVIRRRDPSSAGGGSPRKRSLLVTIQDSGIALHQSSPWHPILGMAVIV